MLKFINFIKNDKLDKINLNLIENKLNKTGNALNIITSGTNKNNVPIVDRNYTHLLYFSYLKIYNIVKNNQKQQGTGLKIITPKQMLSCLPVLLFKMHAGNNSTKLKNEIKQLLYSLYR